MRLGGALVLVFQSGVPWGELPLMEDLKNEQEDKGGSGGGCRMRGHGGGHGLDVGVLRPAAAPSHR